MRGPERIFLPGWGARGSLYASGLPEGWVPIDPPGFRACGGSFDRCRRWIVDELDRTSCPVDLAGHSMGAALAIVAAAARPDRVRRLVLISPAGLPLTKPISNSLGWFVARAMRGWYPVAETLHAIVAVSCAPFLALKLAREVHGADLTAEMGQVRRAATPATVIGCASDTLVTVDHCRRAAELLGADYRELDLDGGHMWMLRDWPRLSRVLA